MFIFLFLGLENETVIFFFEVKYSVRVIVVSEMGEEEVDNFFRSKYF